MSWLQQLTASSYLCHCFASLSLVLSLASLPSSLYHHLAHLSALQLHWNKDHQLRQETSFNGNTDIMLSLIDPSKAVREQQLPIKLSFRAQFSHYAITPARGMHFGPTTYNSLSKPRTFEVVNLGEFPFTLRVFDLLKRQSLSSPATDRSDDAPKSAGRSRPGTGKLQACSG